MNALSSRFHALSASRRTFLAQLILMVTAPHVLAEDSNRGLSSRIVSGQSPSSQALLNQAKSRHIVLLGDSTFDNGSYTNGGPDVIAQVRNRLPAGWKASLLAVDGATTQSLDAQLARLPKDASHLVMSVGGNDALGFQHILRTPVNSVADAMTTLAATRTAFEANYRHAITACLKLALPLTTCTIYNGNFADRSYQLQVSTALTVFNDVILRVAVEHGLTVLDLRQLFTGKEDYANPIEPSSIGGAKLASAIIQSMSQQVHSTKGRMS